MRDRGERVCSSYWDVEARLTPRDKQLVLTLAPDSVAAVNRTIFKEEPPAKNVADGAPLNVKVLINFAPQNSSSAMLQPFDTDALASTLRLIAREPKIRKFSVVAFNLQEERVVFRQENTDQIDFPALGEALKPGSLGTVNVKQLSQKNSEAQFFAELLGKEMNDSTEHPDAVIIPGLKTTLDQSVPEIYLNQLNDVDYPVFYMNVSLDPPANPWHDVIGRPSSA
jgi:hypothetical protein